MKKWLGALGLLTVLLFGTTNANNLDLLTTTEKGAALSVAEGNNNYVLIENAIHALGTMSTQNAGSVLITGGAITGITDLAVADGGTGASTASGARTNLGLAIGSDVPAWAANLDALAGLTGAANKAPIFTGVGTMSTYDLTAAGLALLDDASATAQRSTLGLGTIATQASSAVSITGGTITGITDLAVADGGTGAGDAATARANLGLSLGSQAQAWDTDLDALAGVTYAANTVPLFSGAHTAGAMTVTAAAQTVLDDTSTANMLTTLGGQPLDTELTALAGLTSAADTLPYFNGAGTATTASFTAAGRTLAAGADAAAQRTSLGLGTMATQAASAVNISGGTITGITDLAIADGGTGASTAANARIALGVVPGTDVQTQDAELSVLAGLTNAADAVPIFSGGGTGTTFTVTSAARTVLDDTTTGAMLTTLGAQPADADLTSFAGNSTNGLIAHTAANTITARTLTGDTTISVTNGDGAAGNPTLVTDTDVAALGANSTNGLWARTGSGTGSARTITGSSGITVTNGDGVSGAPAITMTSPTTYVKLTSDMANLTTTTITDVTGLSFSVLNTHTYRVDCYIRYTSDTSTSGIGVGWSMASAGAKTFDVDINNFAADGSAATWHGVANASDDMVISTGVGATASAAIAHMFGILQPTADGTWQVRAQNEVAAGIVVVKAGSSCSLQDI